MTNVKIEYSFRFIKSLKKSPRKVKIALRNRLELFLTDKYHPILNNHSLSGKYKNYRSINITGDWRAIFRELNDGEIIYFDFIGTHSQLYK
jgi:addiction module RelE/StbE family toxin